MKDLFIAIYNNDTEKACEIIEKHTHFNMPDTDENNIHRTPLAYAAKLKRHKVIKAIVELGINVNDQLAYQSGTSSNRTALHEAAENNDKKLIAYLLQKGADPDIRFNESNVHNWSALHLVAVNRFADNECNEAAKLLLHAGADPICANAYPWVPFTLAVYRKKYNTATTIINAPKPTMLNSIYSAKEFLEYKFTHLLNVIFFLLEENQQIRNNEYLHGQEIRKLTDEMQALKKEHQVEIAQLQQQVLNITNLQQQILNFTQNIVNQPTPQATRPSYFPRMPSNLQPPPTSPQTSTQMSPAHLLTNLGFSSQNTEAISNDNNDPPTQPKTSFLW